LWQKLKKNDYDINKIYDVIALRIIVPSVSDCYQALGVIHGLYKPIQGRFKDYIAVPKPNGYKSLHTSVFTGGGEIVEIQIRTQAMHEEAEYGIASHLSYKGDKAAIKSKGVDEKVQWTQELMQWQKNETANKDFLNELKEDFFNHRVFVFTPKGDVIDLPDGSTPIDFAYHIHSDIGDHSQRAYANSKLVPFDYKLKNHDIINIEVSESAKPNRKWINSCKTQLAKRHIRSWLKANGGFVDRLLVRN
jgi:GTP pyrophosphokinase